MKVRYEIELHMTDEFWDKYGSPESWLVEQIEGFSWEDSFRACLLTEKIWDSKSWEETWTKEGNLSVPVEPMVVRDNA